MPNPWEDKKARKASHKAVELERGEPKGGDETVQTRTIPEWQGRDVKSGRVERGCNLSSRQLDTFLLEHEAQGDEMYKQ